MCAVDESPFVVVVPVVHPEEVGHLRPPWERCEGPPAVPD